MVNLDTKPYVEHHPTFGYRYTPGTDMWLERPGGGRYRIRINADGIRADREYTRERPHGKRRAIVIGDSMAAGQFLHNVDRFSDVLERLADVEIINLALEGSGTDQQLLLYEHVGLRFEHDFVILLPFLQNARRNMVDAREAVEPRSGRMILRPKPRFELRDGELVLTNVPVPLSMTHDQLQAQGGGETGNLRLHRLKTRIANLPGASVWRRVVQSVAPWEPFPEYRDAQSPEWRVMSALIRRIKQLAADRPLVVVPTFYVNYVRFRMARNYWSRFASLADTPGILPVDLLPAFQSLPRETAESCFQEPFDMHFSALGHLMLAEFLQRELGRLGLLPAA